MSSPASGAAWAGEVVEAIRELNWRLSHGAVQIARPIVAHLAEVPASAGSRISRALAASPGRRGHASASLALADRG
jgi:hypothetical protein